MENQTQQNRFFIRAISLATIGFWLLTIKTGSSILFSDKIARIKAGKYAPFVLWFNFFSGFTNIIPGAGGDPSHRLVPVFAAKGMRS
ncbi:MAG: hypothetical protein WAT12_12865 [Candidatus Nitrotoga sp.]